MTTVALERVVREWNRSRLDLDSDEILAQVLDRGDLASWRELYRIAAADRALRHRIAAIVAGVPLAYPAFWHAALASLGEPIDWHEPRPDDIGPA